MNGVVVWFTGRPAAGKTTLANAVHRRLVARREACCVLDSDDMRAALVPSPDYSPRARDDFYATLAGVAALLARQGLVVLVPATAHRRAFRALARSWSPAFVEVYVAATREECEQRDFKHLYADAVAGVIVGLPGVDVTYEPPDEPDVIATGGLDEEAAEAVVAAIDSSKGGESWHHRTGPNVSEWS